ncbi:MAG: lytic transglycosylase domain-containing protein [Deltaproteobacteria bacterium]|nr:lytic transglycosylase domain-containing protein [Deltaproteobacteria bacterium]
MRAPLTLLTAVFVVALAPSARADIYECRAADGSREFTNVRQPGRNCRVLVHESDERRRRAAANPGSHSSRPAAGGPLANAARNRPQNTAPDPHKYTRYDHHIREAARLYQLPAPFIRAVMKVESNFNPNVVSRAGAIGLMQLMPRTAANMGVRDPFDPRQNILGGARYLRILANLFGGDLVLTVAAYNAGEGAVQRYSGIPPYSETRRYVRRVLSHYYRYRSGGTDS